jgi:hypothetical protein
MENISIKEKKHALRLTKISCKVTQLIMHFYNINEFDAISDFYNSMTYKLLSDYNTELWWYSVYAIFEIYKSEKETGSSLNSPYLFGENS